ncbi:hypothetical protein E1A91_D12G073700v1 [Gossypium mustelinum]|uniref:TF-B3 domain-containing protein n=1 Tax=Gossypium mustelinum TaxID=34275 RepID=A0A5D2SAG1_GOSMU|nr:hypothetical protein E1A91_D12G073700v1 [Gossypium mustelinum]
MFTSKTPHFFKVILQETLTHGRLGVPRNFVRKYGNQLSSPVKLEVPNGAIWQVELTKSTDEKLHLQNGWREFAEHYLLEFGSFVVFRYEGNDRFHVLIFDKSASEIDYPYTSTEDDDVSGKSKEKSHLPCPLPQKKMRIDSPNQHGQNSKLEVLSSGISSDVQRSVTTEALSCVQRLAAIEKAHAVQIASAFKSTENPVFMVVMRPSYVLGFQFIPSDFARKFLTMCECNLTLCNSTGKTWHAKFFRYPENKKPNAHLYGGWCEFVEDNHLNVGDICVFELIKHPVILMKVQTYPVPCKLRTNPSESNQAKGIKLEKEKKSLNFQYLTKEVGGELKYSVKNDSGRRSSARRRPKPDPVYGKQRACVGASAFRTSNPSFSVVIQPSYIGSSSALHIPVEFVKRYLKKSGEMVLRVADGRIWIVEYRRTASNKGRKAKFGSRSWGQFAKDNQLEVGDVCVFELMNENGNLLEVAIHRKHLLIEID